MPAQMLLDDEAQAHPAQDHHQCPGGDGPHRRPRLPDEGMFIGQVGRGPGEDVAHDSPSLPVALGYFRSCASLHHSAQGSVGALDQPSGSGPGPAVRFKRAQHLVPQPLGLVDGYQGVEDVALAAAGARDGQDHQVCLLRVQLGMLV